MQFGPFGTIRANDRTDVLLSVNIFSWMIRCICQKRAVHVTSMLASSPHSLKYQIQYVFGAEYSCVYINKEEKRQYQCVSVTKAEVSQCSRQIHVVQCCRVVKIAPAKM